jgi:hypothetical protein
MRYENTDGKRIFACPQCGAHVERVESLQRFALSILAIGLVLLGIELLIDPSRRMPTIFGHAPWATVVWIAAAFLLLLVIGWRWIARWCFKWRLVE